MILGWVALVAYVLCIPAANWLIQYVGTVCMPDGPCLVPVWWGVYCPSGSLMIGLALVLRDVVQRALGARWSLGAIAAGTLLSGLVAPPALVIASCTSFFFSELADFAVYTPLYRRRFVVAVAASSMVGLTVDSVMFLLIAFGSTQLLLGVVLGKVWMVLAALPFMVLVRRHYERLEERRVRRVPRFEPSRVQKARWPS